MPRMISNGTVTTVVGSEMIQSFSITSTFQPYQVPIFFGPTTNPTFSLAGTWLAQQALLFNKFKFKRLTLRYEPFVPTTTQGRIMIAWNGDVNDARPTSAPQVSQYQNAVEAPVWRQVSCNALITRQPEYIVTTATTEEGGPGIQGAFIIGMDQGASSTAVPVGSLYLDYEVDLWSRAAYAVNA